MAIPIQEDKLGVLQQELQHTGKALDTEIHIMTICSVAKTSGCQTVANWCFYLANYLAGQVSSK